MEKSLNLVFSSRSSLSLKAEREFLYVEIWEKRVTHPLFPLHGRPKERLAPVIGEE